MHTETSADYPDCRHQQDVVELFADYPDLLEGLHRFLSISDVIADLESKLQILKIYTNLSCDQIESLVLYIIFFSELKSYSVFA